MSRDRMHRRRSRRGHPVAPCPVGASEKDGDGTLDFEPILGGIAPYLGQADLSLCNLETPLHPRAGPYQGYPMFTVPQEIVPALKAVGYDGCTTASNHSMDAGVKGVLRTLDALKAAGMVSTGSYRSAAEAKKPLITQVGGAKVAVIAGTYSLNGMSEDAPWRVDDMTRRLAAGTGQGSPGGRGRHRDGSAACRCRIHGQANRRAEEALSRAGRERGIRLYLLAPHALGASH